MVYGRFGGMGSWLGKEGKCVGWGDWGWGIEGDEFDGARGLKCALVWCF